MFNITLQVAQVLGFAIMGAIGGACVVVLFKKIGAHN